MLTLEATADGIVDSALATAHKVRFRPVLQQSSDWVDALWAKVARAVLALDGRWPSHLSGPLDLGPIALGCALGYLELRHDARDCRQENDALAA